MNPNENAPTLVIDAACDLFEAQWKSGKSPLLEDFLARRTGAEYDRLLTELLRVEVEYRLRRGDRPTAGEYHDRFPEQYAAIAAAFEPTPAAAESFWPETRVPASNETESNAQAILTVLDGPRKGAVFTFTGHETFIVGRSNTAHLSVEDAYLSRNHCLLEIAPPLCRLTDMGSRNRTSINGEPVPKGESRPLKDGDEIRAGHTVIKLRFGAKPEASVSTPTLDAEGATANWEAPQSMNTSKVSEPNFTTRGPASGVSTAHAVKMEDFCPRVDGYKIERELGQGGMGVVYLATRQLDGSQVALKMIVPGVNVSSAQRQRFIREANILKQLDHKHIVPFLEAGESEGVLFLAMAFIEGTDADALVRQQGPLAVHLAVRMTYQLLSALEYAHGKQFVHRDVKPANMLVTPAGTKQGIKLADFGLARVYQASQISGLTLEGDVGGTVAFMAPEQVLHFRKTPPSADLYSAAATLYYLLTGKVPFDFKGHKGDSLSVVLQSEPIPIQDFRSTIPDGLAAVIAKMLRKDPAQRYADATAIKAALAAYVNP